MKHEQRDLKNRFSNLCKSNWLGSPLVFTNTSCWRLPMKLAMKIAPGQNGLSFVDMDFASFFISNLHHLVLPSGIGQFFRQSR
ncbi:hypothetical protein T06_16614 [Trichinella sp. T6]|nr:hypothetical protein T06_16614 [Trichinella sp. T6]KRZ94517.1 hypothetical protein T08_2169 [Trichinella sp. T8]